MIILKNLIKKYIDGNEESIIINNISLQINEGEFISIIGQSGSGKSKLLHLIGGLDSPTSGQILYNDIDITSLNDKKISKYRRETIGYVFQDFNLDGTKTVFENVMLPMVFCKIPRSKRKEKVLETLDKVGMKDKAYSKANTLSGGQKQRVAIARALINNPKIILADEPTGNLDSKNGKNIIELLKSLNKKGYTIIMVTHNLEQTNISDRIIRIKDGEIVEDRNN